MEQTETEPAHEKSEDEKQLESLGDLASKGLRGPKYGIFEQLLSQHLVLATLTSDPLRKIQLVCEASLLVDEEKRRAIQLDLAKVDVVKTVNDALQHKILCNLKQKITPVVTVKFGFEPSEENYGKYVAPWWRNLELSIWPHWMKQTMGKTYRVFFCSSCSNRVGDDLEGNTGMKDERCIFCGRSLSTRDYSYDDPQPYFITHRFKAKEDVPYWQLFFSYCHALNQSGYNTLETCFLKWSIPLTMQTMAKLTKAVKPGIFRDILKMFARSRETTTH